jgi:hypothetical protein
MEKMDRRDPGPRHTDAYSVADRQNFDVDPDHNRKLGHVNN